jgi:ribonuclease PH
MSRRIDGRSNDQLRPCTIETGWLRNALGSVLVSTGNTRVLCAASMEAKAPPWLTSGGWVTAEYSMLPGSTSPRARRDPGGRGKEIQRLVGRSLRAGIDLAKLRSADSAISIVCDCDVLDADGGTRTAAITGAWVALALAVRRLRAEGVLLEDPLLDPVAAVSVGIVPLGGVAVPMLDLCYEEDSAAHVDLNVVQRGQGALVEIQGTAERDPFDRAQLDTMLDLAARGIDALMAEQRKALESAS